MVDIKDRVILLTDSDLEYPFDGKVYYKSKPRHPNAYGYSINIDSFPAYSHSIDIVLETVDKVENIFPIKVPPNYYLLSHESENRTNGFTSRHHIYNDNKDYEFEPYIVLSGKRIPPMPEMSRYLVSHEYGHVLKWVIEKGMGFEADSEDLYRYYCELRNIKYSNKYGGRAWHNSCGEILANDFRIVLCGITPDFWPHDCEYPMSLPKVIKFWEKAREKYIKT